jgi:IS5 family transposase
MLGKTEKNPQLNLAEVPLIHFINPAHELCKLVRNADWEKVEKEYAGYYSHKGAPSIPIRIMVSLIILKQVYRYSDKNALSHWIENPYWQYFSGEVYFQHKAPFYFSDFSPFRKRIGKEGERKINDLGTDIFGRAFETGLSGKKEQPGSHKGFISGMVFRFGNFLMKISSH